MVALLSSHEIPACGSPKLSRQFVRTDFGIIHVLRSESASGNLLPVLCLHMGGDNAESFSALMEASAGVRDLIAIDYPGAGQSELRDGVASVELFARAAWSVLDAYGYEKVIIFGHHTGSKVAVEMATQKPNRVQRIIMAATSFNFSTQPNSGRGNLVRSTPTQVSSFMRRLDQVLPRSSPDSLRLRMLKEYLTSNQAEVSAMEAANSYNTVYKDRLTQIEHQVDLIVLGDELVDETPKALTYLRNVDIHEKLNWEHGFLETYPDEVLMFLENLFASGNKEDSPKSFVGDTQLTPLAARLKSSGRMIDLVKRQPFEISNFSHESGNDLHVANEFVFFLVSGEATLCQANRGRVDINQLFFPGDQCIITDADIIMPLTKCQAIIISKSYADQIIQSSTYLSQIMLEALESNVESLREITTLRGRVPAEQAVASLLLHIARRQNNLNHIDLNLTRVEMAQILGLVFETVSRCFSKLRKLELIDHGRQVVKILEPEQLADFSIGKTIEKRP